MPLFERTDLNTFRYRGHRERVPRRATPVREHRRGDFSSFVVGHSHIVGILLVLGLSAALRAQVLPQDAQRTLDRATRGTPAVALVFDVRTGHILAAARLNEVVRSTPGSVLKPFFLMHALQHELMQPQTTVMCRRTLTITGRNVDCTHPQSETVLDAEQALAYSCNIYFAELAKRFTPDEAVGTLRDYGVLETSSPGTTATVEQMQLLILGLEGVSITPFELADAYRKLAGQLVKLPPDSPMQAVERGLEDSVAYGMAHNAYVDGLSIAGKTGTASDHGRSWTHGWFAGFAPAKSPRVVVVVYLPRGNGADAAHVAQVFFKANKGTLLLP
jgi:membrane peptidoglycan carboxypeptidase